MRLAIVIISLAAVAVGIVHIRRWELATRYEIQKLQTQHTQLRRDLGTRKVAYGRLIAPAEIRRRAELNPLGLQSAQERLQAASTQPANSSSTRGDRP